ncbi:MAG: rubrerythrin family protein [Caldisphaera sp.]|nr:rubrerythrin family protein [Caldisphaera sp.]
MSKHPEMTENALESSYGGESMAHMRYLIFAEIAEKEGFKNVSRLFKAIAYAEQVHARNHFSRLDSLKEGRKVVADALFGPGNTSKNLELAIMGEEFEVEQMYPAYIELAKFQKDKQAEMSFRFALEAEKIHAKLFKEAKKYVDEGKDMPIDGYIWICPVCGHTLIAKEPPGKCPICAALGATFLKF